MSTPLTPSKLLAALKAEGLTVREYAGWRDRCRCHEGSHEKGERRNSRGWGSVHGTVVHITAGNLGTRSVETYIRDIINGDPNVPTKSQFVVAPDGTVWVNSAGRCNHAGQVGVNVERHLIDADFSTTSSYDSRFRGSARDGNSITYGIENIAATTMTAAQREASVGICAAIAKAFGWTGQESVGHGELSAARGKGDPNLNMGEFRRDVMTRVKGEPAPTVPVPTPTPVPVPPAKKVERVTVLALNLASRNAAVNKAMGAWATVRALATAAYILKVLPELAIGLELYAKERKVLDRLIGHKYLLVAVKGGRVIYRRRDSVTEVVGGSRFIDLLPGTGTKWATDRTFRWPGSGALMNLGAGHLSFETTAKGVLARAKQVPAWIAWKRKQKTGVDVYIADVNSPFKSTTRQDDVGPIFARFGLHDFGHDANATPGRGRYHLIRGFGGVARAKSIKTEAVLFTDHSAVLFDLEIPVLAA